MYDSSSRDSDSIPPSADKDSSDTEDSHDETDLRAEIGRKIETLRAQTPTMTSPIGCSSTIAPNTAQLDPSGTPVRGQKTSTVIAEQELTGKPRLKQIYKEMKNQVRFELEPRRSERVKTAKRIGKLGGVEYFLINVTVQGTLSTSLFRDPTQSRHFPLLKVWFRTKSRLVPLKPAEGEM